MALGLYPSDNLDNLIYKEFEEIVSNNQKRIFAIGEIGIDFKEGQNKEIQEKFFTLQLELAQKLKIPAIIHSRKAEKEVLKILENYPKLKKILHCFSGKFSLVKKADEMGCYFSIPTNIVKNEHFQKMVKELPKNKILTETDAPFLSPYPEKRNQPAFIKESIKKISEIWNLSEKQTENQIERNFLKAFYNS